MEKDLFLFDRLGVLFNTDSSSFSYILLQRVYSLFLSQRQECRKYTVGYTLGYDSLTRKLQTHGRVLHNFRESAFHANASVLFIVCSKFRPDEYERELDPTTPRSLLSFSSLKLRYSTFSPSFISTIDFNTHTASHCHSFSVPSASIRRAFVGRTVRQP